MKNVEPAPHLEVDPATDMVSRYAEQLVGSLRCFDRVIVHGTLVEVTAVLDLKNNIMIPQLAVATNET